MKTAFIYSDDFAKYDYGPEHPRDEVGRVVAGIREKVFPLINPSTRKE